MSASGASGRRGLDPGLGGLVPPLPPAGDLVPLRARAAPGPVGDARSTSATTSWCASSSSAWRSSRASSGGSGFSSRGRDAVAGVVADDDPRLGALVPDLPPAVHLVPLGARHRRLARLGGASRGRRPARPAPRRRATPCGRSRCCRRSPRSSPTSRMVGGRAGFAAPERRISNLTGCQIRCTLRCGPGSASWWAAGCRSSRPGMGWVSGANLTAATSAAGGFGILAAVTMTPDQLREAVRRREGAHRRALRRELPRRPARPRRAGGVRRRRGRAAGELRRRADEGRRGALPRRRRGGDAHRRRATPRREGARDGRRRRHRPGRRGRRPHRDGAHVAAAARGGRRRRRGDPGARRRRLPRRARARRRAGLRGRRHRHGHALPAHPGEPRARRR